MTSQNQRYPMEPAQMVPLAPAPYLPHPNAVPQLNVPMQRPQQEAALAAPHEEDLTSDLHFPVRLHYMLTDIHKEGVHTHIVSWQPHGRCFVVHDKKQFVDKILCLWFRQSKWPSFQRQLNMYGFKRLSHGMDKGGYYHEMFLQNYPLLAKKIQRHKIKGNGPRRPAQPDQEPNFYSMPGLVPEALLPYQSYVVNLCYPMPSGSITLRSSLALTANQASVNNAYRSQAPPQPMQQAPPQPMMPQIQAPKLMMPQAPQPAGNSAPPPLMSTQQSAEAAAAAAAAAATEPISVSTASTSTQNYDEDEIDALDQLASWF